MSAGRRRQERQPARRVYLDHAATVPARPEVMAFMRSVERQAWGNASSVHEEGRQARALIERAREQLAGTIGALPEEIVFTSGGTEADNTALLGVVPAIGRVHAHVIVTGIEHPAVLRPCERLAALGYRVSHVGCDESGVLDLRALDAVLDADTVLLSVMHVNNEVGSIQPLGEVARRAKSWGARLHSDAVQSLGRLPIDVRELGVDLMSFSGHKIGGPVGVGALYVRKGTPFQPLISGGHQEAERRAGTEPALLIAGFGRAVELAEAAREREWARVQALRERFLGVLAAACPGLQVNGSPEQGVPHIVNVSFPGIDGERAMFELDARGVAVSTGAACAATKREVSHVLVALCYGRERCRGSLRFSFGGSTRRQDIDWAARRVVEVIRDLST